MELKNQVCSLELANRLRELGVKQESIFWHWATDVEEDGLTWWTVVDKEPRRGKRVRELSTPDHYRGKIAAFTVAELGEMLPMSVEAGKPDWEMPHTLYFNSGRLSDEWEVCYSNGGSVMNHKERANTEADARAKMLVYLLDNHLVTLPSRQ